MAWITSFHLNNVTLKRLVKCVKKCIHTSVNLKKNRCEKYHLDSRIQTERLEPKMKIHVIFLFIFVVGCSAQGAEWTDEETVIIAKKLMEIVIRPGRVIRQYLKAHPGYTGIPQGRPTPQKVSSKISRNLYPQRINIWHTLKSMTYPQKFDIPSKVWHTLKSMTNPQKYDKPSKVWHTLRSMTYPYKIEFYHAMIIFWMSIVKSC